MNNKQLAEALRAIDMRALWLKDRAAVLNAAEALEMGIEEVQPSEWAPDRIWLQRDYAVGGGHTWCEDSQDGHEQAEYVRVGADLAGQADADARGGIIDLLKPTDLKSETYGYREPIWRMSAYYYGFEPTGIAAIDKILSAVACAGKAYHHTESWENDCSPYDHLTGESPVSWIQNAANDAAELIRSADPIKTAPVAAIAAANKGDGHE